MSNERNVLTHQNVPCPFCGLGCDDLVVQTISKNVEVIENGCPRSILLFNSTDSSTTPEKNFIEGQEVGFDQALKKAAEILVKSKRPFISGLATDVAGMRSAMELADHIGAVVDHMSSNGLFNNLLALQSDGYINTTFTEVRNRADVIVIAGNAFANGFSRFFERLIRPEGMFVNTNERKLVVIGEVNTDFSKELAPGQTIETINCKNEQLGEVLKGITALINKGHVQSNDIGGISIDKLRLLAEQMQTAKYGVVVWSASDFKFSNAELTVQSINTLVKALNKNTRFAGLPLGGNDGIMTANQVCTWQTGFSLRTSFANGKVDYDPYQYSLDTMLDKKQLDSLLWISGFDSEQVPPVTDVPTIVLGRAGMTFQKQHAVYIPVATPGIHHAGNSFRGDSNVSLRLRKLTESSLPPVHKVLDQLLENIRTL